MNATLSLPLLGSVCLAIAGYRSVIAAHYKHDWCVRIKKALWVGAWGWFVGILLLDTIAMNAISSKNDMPIAVFFVAVAFLYDKVLGDIIQRYIDGRALSCSVCEHTAETSCLASHHKPQTALHHSREVL